MKKIIIINKQLRILRNSKIILFPVQSENSILNYYTETKK